MQSKMNVTKNYFVLKQHTTPPNSVTFMTMVRLYLADIDSHVLEQNVFHGKLNDGILVPI